MVLLNADSWRVAAIANMYQCHEHTVRAALNHWKDEGLYGLWEKEGRGQKRTWQTSDLEYLEQCLGEEERTYNSSQLARKLWEERRVKLSADRVRKLLKKGLSVEAHPSKPPEPPRCSGQDRCQKRTEAARSAC